MKMAAIAEPINLLAERIVAGEVVFFIGSGYSNDSEGNTARRFSRRLLARLVALLSLLRKSGREKELVADVEHGLKTIFGIEGNLAEPQQYMNLGNIQKLARDYYAANDWVISSFERILKSKHLGKIVSGLAALEGALLDGDIVEDGKKWPKDDVKLDRLKLSRFQTSMLKPRDRGKALFLETIGLTNRKIMAGMPMVEDADNVANSFGDRLRPRHFVLAWLAREGLCRFLLTTNFDLLLEGGFRMAGFSPAAGRKGPAWKLSEFLPFASVHSFCRIADAGDFLDFGHGHGSALLVKIHGCAERYSDACLNPKDKGSKYLHAVVFTYREIQNWRQDAWSRDLLRTLLRTRTLAFCGYSGMDPVIHDTFRTVYEEMSLQRTQLGRAGTGQSRAFFFGNSKQREFHGMEILRAASQAAGGRPEALTEHSQYVPFNFKNEGFPSLDETLLWVYHVVIRRRQLDCLRRNLRHSVSSLLGQRPIMEIEAVCENFISLCENERAYLSGASTASGKSAERELRVHWQWITGWTAKFCVLWMRELALVEGLQRNPGAHLEVEEWRRRQWYYPLADQPEWAAWGVVVELALRRLVATARGELKAWNTPQAWIHAEADVDSPSILFSHDPKRSLPSRLNIRYRGPLPGLPIAGPPVFREHHWALGPSSLFWPTRRYTKAGSKGRVQPPEPGMILLKWAGASPGDQRSAEVDLAMVLEGFA